MQFHQGLRLKKFIENKKYSNAEIIKKSGIKSATFYRMIAEKQQLPENFINVLGILEVSTEEFFREDFNNRELDKSRKEFEILKAENAQLRDKYYSLLERFSDLQDSSNILNKKIKVKQ